MALASSDFIVPDGDLSVDLYPLTSDERDAGTPTASEKLTTYVTAWLTEAESLTTDEDAQKAWVYYRAYRAVYLRLSSAPSDINLKDQGARKYLIDQIKAFKELSDGYLYEYQTLTSNEDEYEILRSRR